MRLQGISNKGLARIAQFTSPDEGAFQLSELSEKAQERALQQYIEHLSSYEWYDFVYGDAKEDAPPYFDVRNIDFSGFASQGDGASWSGTVNLLNWCEAHGNTRCADLIRDDYIEEAGVVTQEASTYSHSGTMGLDIDDYTNDDRVPGSEAAADEMRDEVLTEAKDYADQIYRNLEETYNYECSQEAFEDSVAANEWLFDAEGNIVG